MVFSGLLPQPEKQRITAAKTVLVQTSFFMRFALTFESIPLRPLKVEFGISRDAALSR
jgi:hypothetical protein